MTPELAKAALHFLSRADIKGAEAIAFMQVVGALDAVANPKPAPQQKPKPETKQ